MPPAIRRVIQHYSGALLPSVPSNNEKIGYGPIHLQKSAFLFDLIHMMDPVAVAVSEEPLSMESMDQVRFKCATPVMNEPRLLKYIILRS